MKRKAYNILFNAKGEDDTLKKKKREREKPTDTHSTTLGGTRKIWDKRCVKQLNDRSVEEDSYILNPQKQGQKIRKNLIFPLFSLRTGFPSL